MFRRHVEPCILQDRLERAGRAMNVLRDVAQALGAVEHGEEARHDGQQRLRRAHV